jgi:dienelactone hydrolase
MRVFLILFLFTITLSSQISEKVFFESANPFAMSDVINDLENQDKQEIYGILTLPNDSVSDQKYPLIIGVAGSLAWRDHHYEYLDMYQNNGFATFELKSFKSRDIESTVGSQVEVTTAMMILDAYRALEKLSEHPNIDRNKVSITGWSLGGAVSLFSAWLPIKNAITKEVSFASHLPIYPPCFVDPENTDFTDAPIHILIGEIDNWTPAKPCIEFVKKINKKGNVGLTIYPNSHHSFDSKSELTQNEKGYSFKDCMFKLSDDGDVLMNYLSLPMSSPFMQKIGFLFCVNRGVTLGGNPQARKMAFKFAKDFMKKTLK